jgi:predicted short-subunit dehydrogenase-like oxidoreductase (DUF2520 family)
MNVVIVGRGRVGSALSSQLKRDGTHQIATTGREPNRKAIRTADVVILAVPDQAIESVASRIAAWLRSGATVLHCAGARGADELDACAAAGAEVGVMHPLVSFPSRRRRPGIEGTTFAVNGSPKAVAVSRRLAKACGARIITVETSNPVYHAGAALVANGAAALAFVSVGLFEGLGLARTDAEHAIGALLESVGRNVRSLGVPGALTGPIARGDASTVERHRRALRHASHRALSAYDAVLPVILSAAKAAGLSRARADDIKRVARERS